MTKKQKISFILILALAFIFRVIRLDQAPPHLSNDEISIAYDAYSVSKTLRDEHNHFLPLSFQSHNTYKAPLAIYIAIPSILLFGNNEYGVRMPSVIFGILTILFLGLTVYELTKNSKLSLVSSFILAITPWHIYTSRMALESNIALFFVVAGVYCFYRGLHINNKLFTILSFILFALSIYSYHTEWIFTPMLLFILLLVNYKVCHKNIIYYIGAVVFMVLLVPIFLDYLNNLNTYARANTENLLNDPILRKEIFDGGLNVIQKGLLLSNAILSNYVNYLNLGYLFFNGLNLLPAENPYQVGLFFSIFLPPFLIGLMQVKKYFKENALFIYLWVIVSPTVSAITIGGHNHVRNLVSVIPYSIVIAIGIYIIWGFIKKSHLKVGLALGIFFISILYFILIYYYHFPIQSAVGFQYGYKEIALYIEDHYETYQKVVIDPRFGEYNQFSGVPHLYISYFIKIDPEKFLRERKDTSSGMSFDKYEIRSINWYEEKVTPRVLYIVPNSNTPADNASNREVVKQIKEINSPYYAKPMFKLFTYKD